LNRQQLRSLREAARQQYNLTEVALALHTSQPGVSRQIRELEDELSARQVLPSSSARHIAPAGGRLDRPHAGGQRLHLHPSRTRELLGASGWRSACRRPSRVQGELPARPAAAVCRAASGASGGWRPRRR